MKFSLKQLILFVTIAALLCGVVGYSYTLVQRERHRAMQAMMEAEQAKQMMQEHLQLAEEIALQQAEAALAELNQSPQSEFKYSILYWNIESGGNDPATIAKQLIELGRYDIVGLSEVADPELYVKAVAGTWPHANHFVRGNAGVHRNRETKRLLLYWDSSKFDVIQIADVEDASGMKLNAGRRAPLYVGLKDRSNNQKLIVILNHTRGNDEFTQQQAARLREWARNKATPIVAIGDYNFDYDFQTKKGNAGFDEFLKDGVWKWIKPDPMIDTNWSDDGKGNDRYPDSMLDFNFVAGAAKDWKAKCRVIVREGDFPDDDKTSDHRPVELILTQ